MKPYIIESVILGCGRIELTSFPPSSPRRTTGCVMERVLTISLLDTDGRPFHPRIERVLIQLMPRLRRAFPSFQDEVVLTEIMEEAGRRLRQREQQAPIERLH